MSDQVYRLEMKRRIQMSVTLVCDNYLPNVKVREELLRAEIRANEGMVVRLHFDCPDDIKHDDPLDNT
ncbi:hypothetical protein LCGC14_2718460 [marine sediment metagenome]|uniref:Uncharacterized protein n=1 Tax=marine sediment metagenome TaxID=412755 RepID=A0A0F9BJY1_9ZZZZ